VLRLLCRVRDETLGDASEVLFAPFREDSKEGLCDLGEALEYCCVAYSAACSDAVSSMSVRDILCDKQRWRV
jgi:hypothetical protein